MGLVMPELGSLWVQELKLVSMLLHGEAHWCRGGGDGYWACGAEVLVFLWRRVDGTGRTPRRVGAKVDTGSVAKVMLILVGT